MSTFIDIRELDYDAVRDIVEQSGASWPADESRESRLFRFQVRRIATEAYRRGMQSRQDLDAAAVGLFSGDRT